MLDDFRLKIYKFAKFRSDIIYGGNILLDVGVKQAGVVSDRKYQKEFRSKPMHLSPAFGVNSSLTSLEEPD